ncbi:MAG TPA: cytochrome P450 [Trebonia sp.]
MSDLSPIRAVTHPDPYPYYARLTAERPFGYDQELGLWVATGAAEVAAVLAEPRLRVRPVAEPVPAGIVGTAAGQVFGSLVRMTDGPLAGRLKKIVVTALGRAEPERVAKIAADRTARALEDAPAAVPLRDIMFAVPAQVTAVLCGLDGEAAGEASRLIGDFVQCLTANATPGQQAAAARAAAALQELLGPALTADGGGLLAELVRAAAADDWTEQAPLLANGIGLLSQTYDATAGLIGNTLLALAREGVPQPTTAAGLIRFVSEVARYDAPVQNTRRFAAEPVMIARADVAAGDAVLVVLAAANRDPAANPAPAVFRSSRISPMVFTFGSAGHACPGQVIAVRMASAIVAELLGYGFSPSSLPSNVTYLPLANARIPVL